MEVAEHIAALRREGALLATAASRAPLDAAVPTCPEWSLRDLVRHIGGVHRWAAWNVSHPSAAPVGDEQEAELMRSWPDDAGLLDWYRDGHAALAATLSDAAPDVACWSFLPAPSPLAFWARRQAHETAIHRADAEGASGPITPFAAEFAADGVDELLLGFLSRRRRAHLERSCSLALRATDLDTTWSVEMRPDGLSATRDARDGTDCSVAASASDLYLLLWNRRDRTGLDVSGDASVLDTWRASMRVRWA